MPRLDLAMDGSITQNIKLRCGYAVVMPLTGDDGATKSGLSVVHQEGVPTTYALVLAVAPYNVPDGADASVNDALPEAGDIIFKKPYAAEPLSAPSIGQGPELEGLAPMERSTRGLGLIALRDILAIVQD